MACPPHISLKINKQEIDGVSTKRPGKKLTELLAVNFGVTSAFDNHTGALTGHRNYAPISLTKRVDKNSPLLHQALVNNQAIDAVITFYRPKPANKGTGDEEFYKIEIDHARITSLTFGASDSASEVMSESVTIDYRAITLTYIEGGISSTDDWQNG